MKIVRLKNTQGPAKNGLKSCHLNLAAKWLNFSDATFQLKTEKEEWKRSKSPLGDDMLAFPQSKVQSQPTKQFQLG